MDLKFVSTGSSNTRSQYSCLQPKATELSFGFVTHAQFQRYLVLLDLLCSDSRSRLTGHASVAELFTSRGETRVLKNVSHYKIISCGQNSFGVEMKNDFNQSSQFDSNTRRNISKTIVPTAFALSLSVSNFISFRLFFFFFFFKKFFFFF